MRTRVWELWDSPLECVSGESRKRALVTLGASSCSCCGQGVWFIFMLYMWVWLQRAGWSRWMARTALCASRGACIMLVVKLWRRPSAGVRPVVLDSRPVSRAESDTV
jgi:hypothetical protein